MRYLLAYHSDTTSEWRCFDTARLARDVENLAGLPDVLRAAPDSTLRWLLARYEIGDFIPGADVGDSPCALVYALEPDTPLFSGETGYVGAWLEMFRLSHDPAGAIILQRPVVAKPAGLEDLKRRAEDPLAAADPACGQTMTRLRDQTARKSAPVLQGRSSRTVSGPEWSIEHPATPHFPDFEPAAKLPS